jgi:hypothetical protein
VGHDGVEHDELRLNELNEEEGVYVLAGLADEVVLLEGLGLEEPVLEGLLVLDLLVGLGGQLDGQVQLVLEQLVPQVLGRLLCVVELRGDVSA